MPLCKPSPTTDVTSPAAPNPASAFFPTAGTGLLGVLGLGVTPRTAEQLRLPMDRLQPAPSWKAETRSVRATQSERRALGMRGEPYQPPSFASTAISAGRVQRPLPEAPLNASARRRLSSGAWLSEMKLKHVSPRWRTSSDEARADTFRAQPITPGTPREGPRTIIDFFEQRQTPTSRSMDPWVLVKRGEISTDMVQRL